MAQKLCYCLLWLSIFSCIRAGYKFGYLKCDSNVPELGHISMCEIDRNRNMIKIEGILDKTVEQFNIHLKMLKREGGTWQPFMADMTVDVCKFFKNRQSYFIPNMIYSILSPFTSVNHTCPYLAGSRIRLWNWTPNEMSKLPLSQGEYAIHSAWSTNNVVVMTINGSVLFNTAKT